jgi:hypothetical protein
MARSLMRREDWPRDAVGVRSPWWRSTPQPRQRHIEVQDTCLRYSLLAGSAPKAARGEALDYSPAVF